MKKLKWFGLMFLLIGYLPAYGFSSVDEQIDYYLGVLATGSYTSKIEMLKKLQWSGLSDPRLYDKIEDEPAKQYLRSDLDKQNIGVLAHQIRALGYSGNEKYRNTLEQIKKSAANKTLRKHASKALIQLDKFIAWNKLIIASDFAVEGKSAEVATYMKMLSVDDVFVQRLAARAIFHERQQDTDLLALVAEKLKGLYIQDGLDGEAQDTAAWFCKAIGQSGKPEYMGLLTKVNQNTPYKKIRKHSLKFIQ